MGADLIYFLGVHPAEDAGHHCYAPGYRSASVHLGDAPTPWRGIDDPLGDGRAQDAVVPGFTRMYYDATKRVEDQPARLHASADGWTLILWWDRSADRRYGSYSAFAAPLPDADAVEALARRTFPRVFARMDAWRSRG